MVEIAHEPVRSRDPHLEPLCRHRARVRAITVSAASLLSLPMTMVSRSMPLSCGANAVATGRHGRYRRKLGDVLDIEQCPDWNPEPAGLRVQRILSQPRSPSSVLISASGDSMIAPYCFCPITSQPSLRPSSVSAVT